MTMIKRITFESLLIFLLLCPTLLHAAEPATLSPDYLERVPARFGYGFMNTVFGWTDLFIMPQRALQDGSGGGDAFGRALTQPFGTTFLGLWDLATFWVPGETGRIMGVPRHVWMTPEKVSSPAAISEQPQAEADPMEAEVS